MRCGFDVWHERAKAEKESMQRRSFVAGLAAAGLLPATPSFAQADPLPSWNAGPVKRV
jgi:hypothetical protein